MVVALTIASWFTAARIVRGQVITLKQNDYVRAAHAVGARWHRVLVRHLLPNTLGVLIIVVFLELPNVVLGEAFLSFIGLGINPPDASWGSLASEGREAYRTHPLDLWIPCLFIAALVLCANFIADGCATPSTRAPGRRRSTWRCSRSRTSGRTSSPARARSRPSTGSRSRWRREDARHRGRVRLREVGDRALDHGPDPEAAGQDRRGLGRLRRHGPDEARRARARGRPREGDRDDLPGPDDVAEPDVQDRQADHGDARAALRHVEGRRPPACDRAPRGGRHPGRRRAARRLPAPVLGRDAPARDDRDRALVRPEAPDRRRADHGARRDHPGADPRPARAAARGAPRWR